MRVVFDTNIWVSALRSRRGASFALLSAIASERFQFGISVPLFMQYRAKLLETPTPLSTPKIHAILAALARFGEPVPIYFRLRPNLRDEADNMVFECAANYGADRIITYNVKDFRNPELGAYRIEPVEPGLFLRMI